MSAKTKDFWTQTAMYIVCALIGSGVMFAGAWYQFMPRMEEWKVSVESRLSSTADDANTKIAAVEQRIEKQFDSLESRIQKEFDSLEKQMESRIIREELVLAKLNTMDAKYATDMGQLKADLSYLRGRQEAKRTSALWTFPDFDLAEILAHSPPE
jgi:Tfp pilus assembly protein PilO